MNIITFKETGSTSSPFDLRITKTHQIPVWNVDELYIIDKMDLCEYYIVANHITHKITGKEYDAAIHVITNYNK